MAANKLSRSFKRSRSIRCNWILQQMDSVVKGRKRALLAKKMAFDRANAGLLKITPPPHPGPESGIFTK